MQSDVDVNVIETSEFYSNSGLANSNLADDIDNLYTHISSLNLEVNDLSADKDGDGYTPVTTFHTENTLDSQEGTLKIFDQRFDALKEDFKKRINNLVGKNMPSS